MNTTSLDLLFLYTYIVNTNHFLSLGTQGTTIPSVFQVLSNHNEIQNLKILWMNFRVNACFSGYLRPKRNKGGISEASVKTLCKSINHVREFDFQYSDITDEEMVLLIDMLVDAQDVHSQHKLDVGRIR